MRATKWPGAAGRVVLSCEVPLANMFCGCICVISSIHFSPSGKLGIRELSEKAFSLE